MTDNFDLIPQLHRSVPFSGGIVLSRKNHWQQFHVTRFECFYTVNCILNYAEIMSSKLDENQNEFL